jgi:hypothetical protein
VNLRALRDAVSEEFVRDAIHFARREIALDQVDGRVFDLLRRACEAEAFDAAGEALEVQPSLADPEARVRHAELVLELFSAR